MKLEFFHIMRRSIAVKHVLLLFLMVTFVLGLGFYWLYRSAYKLFWDNAQREAMLICRENVGQYDQKFTSYEKIAKVLSNGLEEHPVEKWDVILQSVIKKISRIHPEIYAIGAATIPDSGNSASGKLSFALCQDGKVEIRHGTNYADASWFSDVLKKKIGVWNEPFHGKFIPDLIAVYSCPIIQTTADGSRKIVGVVCLALKIDWLNRDIREITLDNRGFAVLLSEQGQFLSSKYNHFIGKRYEEIPMDKRIPAADRNRIVQFVKSKRQDALILQNPEGKEKLCAFCRQMQTTGWMFVVAFPEDTIFASLHCFNLSSLIQIIGVIVVILLSALLMIRRVSLPIHKLSLFAGEIGKGNFSEPIPVVKGHDEIAEMAQTIDKMRYSLIDYIRSVQKITELEEERAKNRKLLLNTLPEHVIEEFTLTGKCTPEYAGSTTVFFSDIVGFTTRCSELPAAVIIDELNSIFSNFDRIFTSHGVERIKTIGDAYMAIAGLHSPKDDHCNRVLDAALEALHYLRERNVKSKLQWRIRVGIHTGSVAAGIVGVERYIYDVFGDAVNTAARMEQLSEPMKINVSEAVRMVASNRRFIKRPPIEVKGKGFLQMYFLEDNEQETHDA